MNGNLLVTGCEGFIGSNFVRYMLDKYPKLRIFNVDKMTYAGRGNNLKGIDCTRYKLLVYDINDINKIYLPKTEWIINFASSTHVDRSIDDPFSFYKNNFLGVAALLEYAKKEGIKFFQIGTDEIYGDIPSGASVETDKIRPSSPYSVSKASADLLVQAYHRTYGVNYIITRSSNNFGPYQYPEKLIPLAITNLLTGKKIPIYGDGKQKRDWLYVLDNVRAIDFLLHNGNLNEIYNIGGFNEEEQTNLDIISDLIFFYKYMIARDSLGETQTSYIPRIEDSEFIEFVTDRLGHDRRYAIDSNKLQALGFKGRDVNALATTFRWYAMNQDWWKRLLKEGD